MAGFTLVCEQCGARTAFNCEGEGSIGIYVQWDGTIEIDCYRCGNADIEE